jgi:hypothetical protein
MKLLITRLGVFLSFVALPLSAHHGKDFLLVESYELPHPGAIYAVSAEEFLFDRSALTFHDEPSLLFGMTDRIAAEVHAHVAKEPRSGFYHDGRFTTLRDVVNHYDTFKSLRLTEDEKNDLVEFLKSL